MSERLKSTNSQMSNEEIIQELTEQFGILSNRDENLTPGDDSSKKPEPSETMPKNKEADNPPATVPESLNEADFDDEPRDIQENDASDSDSDSIDETYLKDQEMDLTDDQKLERKEKAEELKKTGNDAFAVGEYERSKWKYTEALKICPLQYSQQRAILYCNRSAAKIKLKKYDKAIKDCIKAIELDDKYIKAYHRRALSYEQTEKLDESLADYKKILELDPTDAEAKKSVVRLPPLIEERNEKLKVEMLGKLKQLGNMVLKPFGLSTDNFKLEQDPETKGYKINFKQ